MRLALQGCFFPFFSSGIILLANQMYINVLHFYVPNQSVLLILRIFKINNMYPFFHSKFFYLELYAPTKFLPTALKYLELYFYYSHCSHLTAWEPQEP